MVNKKGNFCVCGSKIRPQDDFKKIPPEFKQYGKTLPNHNFAFLEHFSNVGPKKKLDQDTSQPIKVCKLK